MLGAGLIFIGSNATGQTGSELVLGLPSGPVGAGLIVLGFAVWIVSQRAARDT